MNITSDKAFDLIEEIASNASKNTKQDMVAQYAQHPLFKQVLVYALNPFKKYNIRPSDWKPNAGDGGENFGADTWELLDKLANRSLTGHAARDALSMEFKRLSSKSAELLCRIVLKDLRAGFSESTVNKAVKGLIPETPYMRCCLPKHTKLDKFSWVEGVYSQVKADGMYSDVEFEVGGIVSITSRNGTEYPIELFEDLVEDIRLVCEPGYHYHGEMLVQKNGVILARELGNGILNSIQQGGTFAVDEKPVYVMWDRIPRANSVPKGKYDMPYKTRFAELKALTDKHTTTHIKLIETRVVHSLAEAYEHYKEKLAEGKEGTIFKDGNATWKDGTSTQQVKLKIVAECDLIITGFTEGKGKNKATFGSITCETSDGLLVVNVSGFTDKARAEINARRVELTGTIMATKFNDIMYPKSPDKPYSLFLPRHAEFRKDKHVADNLQRVMDQLEAAKQEQMG